MVAKRERAEFKQVFRQAYSYGRCGPVLYHRYRRAGARRNLRGAIKAWCWLVYALPHLRRPGDRLEWGRARRECGWADQGICRGELSSPDRPEQPSALVQSAVATAMSSSRASRGGKTVWARKVATLREGCRTGVTGEGDLHLGETIDLQHTTEGVLAVPTGVLGVYLPVPTPAIDEVAHVESVRGGQYELAAGTQVTPYVGQKAPDIIEVLDELAGKDGIELAAQIEIAGIGQTNVEAFGLELLHGGLVDIDANQIAELLGQQSVQPVGAAVAGGTTQVEHGLPMDERPDHVVPVLKRAAPPRVVSPLGLQEVAFGKTVGGDGTRGSLRTVRHSGHYVLPLSVTDMSSMFYPRTPGLTTAGFSIPERLPLGSLY